ncbi:MAG TPA: hypothetical protein ENH84_05105 [Phycisphaerae bacterium]|nr:hypothetical protein [Phycisphaerae bacterium]
MNTRTLHLEKEGHTYLFRYAKGQEDEVVEEMMHLADGGETDFDWMDAAVLSFQVTHYAAEDFFGAMKPDELAT